MNFLQCSRDCTGVWVCPAKCCGDGKFSVYEETYFFDTPMIQSNLQMRFSKRTCTKCGHVQTQPAFRRG